MGFSVMLSKIDATAQVFPCEAEKSAAEGWEGGPIFRRSKNSGGEGGGVGRISKILAKIGGEGVG